MTAKLRRRSAVAERDIELHGGSTVAERDMELQCGLVAVEWDAELRWWPVAAVAGTRCEAGHEALGKRRSARHGAMRDRIRGPWHGAEQQRRATICAMAVVSSRAVAGAVACSGSDGVRHHTVAACDNYFFFKMGIIGSRPNGNRATHHRRLKSNEDRNRR